MGLENKSYGKRMVPEYLIKALNKLNKATGGNPLVLEKMNKMEEIVDSAGNKRFVEGGIDLFVDATTLGVTKTYGRWSLSGTHLMIVLGVDIPNGTTFSNGITFAKIAIPEFVANKISILWGMDSVDFKKINLIASSADVQTSNFSLSKIDNSIWIICRDTTVLTSDKHARIQFDLLIDDDYSE